MSGDNLVVFAMDVLSEPCRNVFLELNPYIQAKCSRALPIAGRDDVVVLAQRRDEQYCDWLKDLGLGPAEVVEYHATDSNRSLSELIIDNPKPVLEAVERVGKNPIFVPFFSGQKEMEAANTIGADFFGSDEEITLEYFNKEKFKEVCSYLGIPVIRGVSHRVFRKGDSVAPDPEELAQIVSKLLNRYSKVIIRGTEGSAGSSLYKVDDQRVDETVDEIIANRERKVLIEPFLSVIASPNDQWIINRRGERHHLGLTAQLFEGLQHVGNLKGQYFSDRVSDYIVSISSRIVHSMAEKGYCGVLGIDYIVTDEGVFPIENNARMNGSSFTIGTVENLEPRHGRIPVWKFFKAETEPCSFNELTKRLKPLLYDGTSVNAVFPYDCDTLAVNGIFTPIILAEDMYHVDYFERTLLRLGVRPLRKS